MPAVESRCMFESKGAAKTKTINLFSGFSGTAAGQGGVQCRP